MTFRTLVLGIVAVVLLSSGLAMADSLAERLEKGIYTEETVGNLDAAREIYQQIVTDAEADHVVAAQAQFRLGQCFLKQGKKDEAIAAFKKLIEDFADQKELVAKAKKFAPSQPDFEMLPEPWVDGESLQLQAKLGGGLDIGTFVLSVSSSQEDGKDICQTNVGRYISINAPNQGISRVRTDRNTFRPISSLFRHSVLGSIEATYASDEVTINTVSLDGKQSTRKIELNGVYYDNEQGMLLFRRLPLEKGFKAKIPICTTMASGPMEIEVEVTAQETIEVPAGTFECYRLLVLKLQQTFWISTDEHRYLVKFEAGGVSAVLDTIRVNKPGEVVEYRDDELGFSMAAPSEWYFVEREGPDDEDLVVYLLLDPEAEATSSLVAKPIEKLEDDEKESPRALAESRIEGQLKAYKDFKVRSDSWTERTVSGNPGVSYIADYIARKKNMVRYCVYGLGESTAIEFCVKIERDHFDRFRSSFDTIVNTYRESPE
jgi:hypothetical protein